MSLAARVLLLFASSFYVCICATSAVAESFVGRNLREAISSHEMDNSYGKSVALREFDDKPVLVIAFLGTECPLAKLYGPRLSALQEKFAGKGVQIVGVNSNKQDSLTEVAAYVHRYDINFPLLKDVGNRFADALEATRTPEVYVFNAAREVVYHGRIDDQYGVGYAREKPTSQDLAIAMEQAVAQEPVTNAETVAVGCYIGRNKKIEPSGEVTYCKDIAPILNARCVECHRDGEIGPFTLTSYDDVLGWEETILEVIEDRRMPPWNANPEFGHFANDARLDESQIELLRTWVANGMPEGNKEDLPPPPRFVEGWKIGQPDQTIAMREEAFDVPAEGIVSYQRWVVDPGWTEDKYVSAAEARPDNRSVVHHILVYVIPPGQSEVNLSQVLVGYAPGSTPVELGAGVAMHIPAGSKLLFEMHYTPNGQAQRDLSYIGVRFTEKDKVEKLIRGRIALEKDFTIPAGAEAHTVQAGTKLRRDELLVSMTPHMHLRGKAFRYEALYPDGEREVLLDVPNYDFNWQIKYILAEPKRLPKGTQILCTATFDNSEANLTNPDPTIDVRWGDQSWDEMMIGFFDTLPVN